MGVELREIVSYVWVLVGCVSGFARNQCAQVSFQYPIIANLVLP
jgi:hypothetical protein